MNPNVEIGVKILMVHGHFFVAGATRVDAAKLVRDWVEGKLPVVYHVESLAGAYAIKTESIVGMHTMDVMQEGQRPPQSGALFPSTPIGRRTPGTSGMN